MIVVRVAFCILVCLSSVVASGYPVFQNIKNLAERQEWPRALNAIEDLAREHPKSALPWVNAVQALMRAGIFDDKLVQLSERALGLEESVLTLTVASQVNSLLHNHEKSLEYLERAIQLRDEGADLSEGEIEPYWILSDMYNSLFGDTLESIRLFSARRSWLLQDAREGALEARITYYNMSMSVAMFLARHNDFDKAMPHVEDALYVHPSSGLAQRHLDCLIQLGAKPSSKSSKSHHQKGSIAQCKAEWEADKTFFHSLLVRQWACSWEYHNYDMSDLENWIDNLSIEEIRDYRGFYVGMHDSVHQPPPFGLLSWGLPLSLPHILKLSKSQCPDLPIKSHNHLDVPRVVDLWRPLSPPKLLRIGYVSGDLLRQHPVGVLTSAVFQLHDYSKVEVFVFGTVKDQSTNVINADVKYPPVFSHIAKAKFIPIHDLSQSEEAKIINYAKIHILIDLSGTTAFHRQETLNSVGFGTHSSGSAVVISHHGFIGTLGCDFYHAFVADQVVAPPETAPYFSEKLAYLPTFFLPASHRWLSAFRGRQYHADSDGSNPVVPFSPEDKLFLASKKANLLPTNHSHVLCWFNQQIHKLNDKTFATWLKILKQTNTTLWLHQGPYIARKRLMQAVEAADLAPSRVVWTHSKKIDEHTERIALCDLHLDSPMYNSGATGTDVLSSGVPIVTMAGEKVAGRMVSSMLHQLGHKMSSIIARNYEDYEQIVVRLINKKGKFSLKRLRSEMTSAVFSSPLFDIQKWTADWERLLFELWDVHWSSSGKANMHTIVSKFKN